MSKGSMLGTETYMIYCIAFQLDTVKTPTLTIHGTYTFAFFHFSNTPILVILG